MANEALSIEMSLFFSELGLLLEKRMSYADALHIMQQEQADKSLQILLHELQEDVKQGLSLADSFAKYPSFFKPFIVEIVREGEKQQRLATTLTEIGDYQNTLNHSMNDLNKRLLMTFTYPFILLILLVMFVTHIASIVLPTFSGLLDHIGSALPPLTEQIIYIYLNYWWLILLFLIGVIVLMIMTAINDRLLLKIPLIGRFFHRLEIIRFLHTYAFALTQKLSTVQTLAACVQAANNTVYADLFEESHQIIAKGGKLTEAFAKQSLMPQKVKHLIIVNTSAETGGHLFSQLADIYTHEIARDFEPKLKLLSILMTLLIGIIIALIIISIYLPVFTMVTVI